MSILRQRPAVSAVLATSLTVVAGCASANKTGGGPSGGVSSSAVAKSSTGYSAGTLLVSDGTSNVTIGGTKVAFPTTVTDASWSPDGSRIAFIGADGNVDTARPDGSGLLALSHGGGLKRSHPSWFGPLIVFAEQDGSGVSRLEQVSSNGHPDVWWQNTDGEEQLGWPGSVGGALEGNTAPDGNDSRLPNGAPESVAFQHQGADGPEVWIYDAHQRESYAAKVTTGSQPALSPDGTELAYVGTDGQIREISALPVYPGSGSPSPTPTVLSTGVSGAADLAWSPDGTKIAFSTPSGIESVAAHPSGGPAAPAELTSSPGVPSFLTGRADRIDRISAADPVAESIAASQARWPTVQTYAVAQSSQVAMSATLANSAEAATVLDAAATTGGAGPTLLTGSGALDPQVAAELKRIFGTVGQDGQAPTVTIIGGTDQVSADAEKAIQQLGYATKRVTGDRYAINAVQLSRGAPTATTVAVVSDDDPAAAAAVGVTGQVVLTKGASLPAAARTYLARLQSGSTIYAVGAEARDALAAWSGKPAGVTVKPLIGADDAETTALVAQAFDGARSGAVLVDATSPVDLAEGMSTATAFGYALLAVDPAKGLESTTRQWLTDSAGAVGTTVLVGSETALGSPFAQKVGAAVSGPEGWAPSSLMYPN